MKKNSEKDTLLLVLAIIAIIVIIAYVIFNLYTSNQNLRNNTNEQVNVYSENNQNNSSTSKPENNSSKPPQVQKVEEQISTYTTSIYDKDEGRIQNITLANSKLNNTIVKKGEEFSFIQTVGTMGESEGFVKAMGFDSEGNKIEIPGGGICQLSSTLYNAVLDANLEVTERHPHSRRVYYVPIDRDATVFYPDLDLKFINNTEHDIKITVTNDSDNVTVTLLKIIEKEV